MKENNKRLITLHAPKKVKLSEILEKVSASCEEEFKIVKLDSGVYFIRDCSDEPIWRTEGILIVNIDGSYLIEDIGNLPFQTDDYQMILWLYRIAGSEIEMDVEVKE